MTAAAAFAGMRSVAPVMFRAGCPDCRERFELAASALRLAVEIEHRAAGHWRAALAHTTGADRNRALAALTDCALRATRWRRAAGLTPVTVAFPGRPG